MSQVARHGKMTARDGKADELAERMLAAAEDLQSDPGCELYLVHRQADEPDVIWVTELWRSQADLDAAVERVRGSDDLAAVIELVADAGMIELDLLGGKGTRVPEGHGAGPYTVVKLPEVEDMAAKLGFGEMGEARFANEDLATEQTGVSHHRINPDTRQAFAHRHEGAEEVYVVLSGSGRVKLDDEIVELETLDAIRIAPAVVRAFEGGPDGIELLAFGPRCKGDAEIVQGFWSD